MGTKSKKSRAFLVWLCFFLGINLFLGLAAVGLSAADTIVNHFGDMMAVIRFDIKDTTWFKADISDRFEYLIRTVSGADYMDRYVDTFADEGENLLYYAENLNTGKTVGNIERGKVFAQESAGSRNGGVRQAAEKVVLPQGYDYYLYYDGSNILVQNRNRLVNVYDPKSGYQDTWLKSYVDKSHPHPEIRIVLMVKKDIVKKPHSVSSLYQVRSKAEWYRGLCLAFLGAILLDLALLLIALFKRQAKREFDRILARISGRLWFEAKAALSLLILVYLYEIITQSDFSFISCVSILFGLWWFYVMLVDLLINKKRFFTHNSITWLVGIYRRYESKKPFQKALLWRIHALIAAEMVLVLFAFGFAASGIDRVPIALIFVAAGLYLLYLYLRRFRKTVDEMGLLVDRIEAMKNGKYETSASLPPDSDLRSAWENLTLIQSGIQKAVEEKLRSERMKMELITNVSHDLKTPLTSIISYTDLLAREENLPDTARDYVQILSQKADRLKTLIQDLFELSRAASGDMALNMERLDLVRLLEQTLADMNEQIEQSGLTFRVNRPDAPVYILGDGNRLYRVFQNLISNALKYAMKSSRVYVDLQADQSRATVAIKNISSYEMNFDAEEIMERFVRGDKSRSTEGSGLGLAIARSFTQACGGSFDISIDGDLFKVTLGFSRLPDEPETGKVDTGTQAEGFQNTASPSGEALDEAGRNLPLSVPDTKEGEADGQQSMVK